MARIEPTDSVLDPLARLWLARALRCSMKRARVSLKSKIQHWILSDHTDELGLPRFDPSQFDSTYKALKKIIKKLERSAPSRDGVAFRIADFLGKPLELSLVERNVLALAILCEQDSTINDAFDDVTRTLRLYARVAGPAIGVSPDAYLLALDPRGTLSQTKLLTVDDLSLHGSPRLHDGLRTLLREPPRNEAEALHAFVDLAKPSALSLDDVAHLKNDVDTAVALVKGAVAKRIRGVNVLLWGPPGTGKTETARLVAKLAGVELGEVPVAGRGHEKLGAARLGTYVFCQKLLARTSRAAVLFDELEDVQPRSALAAIYGVSESRDDKGLFVRTLEENLVPTIWTTNHVDHVDPALLRRFDLVVEMKVPPERVRRRAVDQHLARFGVDEQARHALAADERLAPAVVARAARVIDVINVVGGIGGVGVDSSNTQGAAVDVASLARRVVDNTLKVVAGPKRTPFAQSPFTYDIAFANASVNLDEMARVVAGVDGERGVRTAARICLYGPPGSGKTAFARHVAARADKRIIVKRMSDLLSCWVGDTEQRIAAMFEEARDDDAVLLLDEADGLLRDRAAAKQSWELTQTNELLVQMEAFEGVFFAATNLVDVLDAAAFRRFDVKVRFDPLNRRQRRAMAVQLGVVDERDLARIDALDGLCAGHFAAVARRSLLIGASPSEVVRGLVDEHHFVRASNGGRVGFTLMAQ